MRIALIAAMAENRVIGRENALPWRLSADLQRFKALTMGKPVIMGRKTYESIGKPLPGRLNIVVTSSPDFRAEGCQVVHSVDEALDAAREHDEAMVIGGAGLYEQMLGRAQRIYLTLVRANVEGDVLFPPLDRGNWREVARESHLPDEKNEYPYDFILLDRKES